MLPARTTGRKPEPIFFMPTTQVLFFALAGGLFPALFWLWFWLKEDTFHHEPRGLIIATFFGGMLAALVSLALEKIVLGYPLSLNTVIIIWAAIEELTKLIAAAVFALSRRAYDEPVDAVVYMICAALGFAAIENTLFILQPLQLRNLIQGLITGNMRFIGASLLDVVASSSVIGLFLAVSFYKSKAAKKVYVFIGLVAAIVLHTLFNLFIINGNNAFLVFVSVWLAVMLLLIAFEKVKKIYPVYK